jgi:hypothetical protein
VSREVGDHHSPGVARATERCRARFGACEDGGVRNPPTSAVVATGLVGGFAIAKYSGRRELGGLFYAACGAWSARQWRQWGGAGLTAGLGLAYVVAFGASHPLAKKIGAWPAVGVVTAVAAGAAAALADCP